MRKKTILLCGPPYSAIGGGPTHIRNLLASPLVEHYNVVHFETGSKGAESPAKDEKFSAKVFRLVASPYTLVWQILRTKPSVVHLNSALNHKAIWRDAIYLILSKLLQKKVVFQLHGGSLSALCARKSVLHVVRKLFSMADAIVLLASSELDEFQRLGIVGRLVVIPNGVDVSQYQGPEKRVHSGEVQQVAYLGRLIRNKGIFEAIQAVEILNTDPQFRELKLKIAGSGPAYEELRQHIKDNKLGDLVELMGSLYGREKVAFLRGADVFLFPTYHTEGLPYTILESLAAGTPVISTRIAGIPDVVSDGEHGILIEPKDPREIVRALKKLARSPDGLRSMSSNCGKWASRQFSLERLARDFEDLYEKVCA